MVLDPLLQLNAGIYVALPQFLHCKKRLATFLFQAGMSLTFFRYGMFVYCTRMFWHSKKSIKSLLNQSIKPPWQGDLTFLAATHDHEAG
jgi:hypothetical protein